MLYLSSLSTHTPLPQTGAEDPHPRSHAWTEAELMRSDVSTELSVLRAVQARLRGR